MHDLPPNARSADLGGLIGSRICHDLISPIGAISNGLELLALAQPSSPELQLINESVVSASARIRFFRIAFGLARRDQTLAGREIAAVLDELPLWSRLSATYPAADDLGRQEARLMFLLILCAENALPAGGRLVITRDSGRGRITGTGRRIHPPDDAVARAIETGVSDGLGPDRIHFAMAAQAAHDLKRQVDYASGEDGVTITF